LRKLFKSYKYLLDKKIENTTFIVLFISALILLVWVYVPNNPNLQLASKNNILEVKSSFNSYSIVTIDWKKYKLNLEELK
jgi:hypothetical protein